MQNERFNNYLKKETFVKITLDEETYRYTKFMRTLSKSMQTMYNIPESYMKDFDCKLQCNLYYFLSEVNPDECSNHLVKLMKNINSCYLRRN